MAKELSRTFDMPNGAIHLQIQDKNGVIGLHTLYVMGVPDIPAAVASLLTMVDVDADALAAKMTQAGYVG